MRVVTIPHCSIIPKKEEMMATIKDVAKLAGVGTSTVSRYFKKGSYISEDAAKRIEAACKELKYYPNAIAKAMKSNQTFTIGLMIPTITNPFFPQLVEIIEHNCMQQGYKTVLCNTNGNIELERHYMEMAVSNCFDGIIMITGSSEFENLISNIPTLTLDRKSANPSNNITIISDNEQGIRIGSEYLIERGCKHILYLGSKDNQPAVVREQAFEKIMKEHGTKYQICEFERMTDQEKDALFGKGFDGVFAWNDIIAIEFMNYAMQRNVRIPEDIQLVGYDNIKISEWVNPGLTTISQPIKEMADLASQYIIELIQDGIKPPKETVLPNTLVVRKTTK